MGNGGAACFTSSVFTVSNKAIEVGIGLTGIFTALTGTGITQTRRFSRVPYHFTVRVEIVPTTFKGLILTGIRGHNNLTNTAGARKPRPAIPARHALLALAGLRGDTIRQALCKSIGAFIRAFSTCAGPISGAGGGLITFIGYGDAGIINTEKCGGAVRRGGTAGEDTIVFRIADLSLGTGEGLIACSYEREGF